MIYETAEDETDYMSGNELSKSPQRNENSQTRGVSRSSTPSALVNIKGYVVCKPAHKATVPYSPSINI